MRGSTTRRRSAASPAWLETDTGPVYVGPGLLALVAPEDAWVLTQELGLRALGQDGGFITDVGALSAEEAYRQFSTTNLTVLGQISSVSPDANAALLDSLLDHGEQTGTLQGLDALVLSAALGCDPERHSGVLSRGADLLNQIGLGERLAGGADHSAVLSPSAHTLGLPDVRAVRDLANDGRLDAAGLLAGAAELASHAGGDSITAAQAKEGVGVIATAVSTGVLAAEIAAPLGPLAPVVGVLAGAAAFIVGLFSGSHDTPPSSSHTTGQEVVVGTRDVTNHDGSRTLVVPAPHATPAATGPVSSTTHTTTTTSVTTPQGTSVTHTRTHSRSTFTPAPPAHCPVDDDHQLLEEPQLPGWSGTVGWNASATVLGSGVAGLVTMTDGPADLSALPQMDAFGNAAESLGFLAEIVDQAVPESGGAEDLLVRGAVVDDTLVVPDRWIDPDRLTPQARLTRDLVVRRLLAARIPPEASLRDALHALTLAEAARSRP